MSGDVHVDDELLAARLTDLAGSLELPVDLLLRVRQRAAVRRRRRLAAASVTAVAALTVAGTVAVAFPRGETAGPATVAVTGGAASGSSSSRSPSMTSSTRVTALEQQLRVDPTWLRAYAVSAVGGAVLCALDVLGTSSDQTQVYARAACQEFLAFGGGENGLFRGSGVSTEVRLTVRGAGSTTELVSWTAPRGDADWAADVRRIFPAPIAARILSSSQARQAEDRLQVDLLAQARAALAAGALPGKGSSTPPASTAPLPASSAAGVVLTVTSDQHLVLRTLPAGSPRPIGAVAPQRAPMLAGVPGRGWVAVVAAPPAGDGPPPSQLALIDETGGVTRFGPVYQPGAFVTGLAVSTDGTKIAVAVAEDSVPAAPARITVAPVPGTSGSPRTWTLPVSAANQVVSLSWAPDGRRLSYIAGWETGGGMGGSTVTLDTATVGPTAPTRSPWSRVPPRCVDSASSWLRDGTLMVLRTCDSADPQLIAVDAATGVASGAPVTLPGFECSGAALHAEDPSRLIVSACSHAAVVTDATARSLDATIADAAWYVAPRLSRP